MDHKIAVIPGDGAGSDIIDAAVAVMLTAAQKYSISICVERCQAGGAALDRYGTPLPDDVLGVCRSAGAVLAGPFGGKQWAGCRGVTDPGDVLRRICAHLGDDVSVCVIPKIKTAEGADDAPLTVIGTRDFATGTVTDHIGRDLTCVLPRGKMRRILLPAGTRVVSTAAAIMRLIRDPEQFDLILAQPDDAEVIASAAALLNGSPAAAHIGFFGGKAAVYAPFCSLPEEMHGTGLCDPSGAILAAAMLFERSIGSVDAAGAIRGALRTVIGSGARAADPSGGLFLSTGEFCDAVIGQIKKTKPFRPKQPKRFRSII